MRERISRVEEEARFPDAPGGRAREVPCARRGERAMSHEYFFELLVEEIPAWMLPHPALRESLEQIYRNDFGIETDALVTVGATPRRIWFRLAGLPEKQADRRVEVKGPPVKAAFDASGGPTPALQGFLKKNGSTI